ncbi:helix-turn-helix transcriptional regulator [Kitasatospora sp. NPDC093550]|uniref:helix-turn-helix transcriptional regulator n=1 Tax=Kitasatospora sp. NPDC093550 TaxID=3364089 RepID=UPI00380AEDB7
MPRPAARVLTLLELLQGGGTRTVAELADRLGVDGRTVRRYVGQLLDLDVPVESVRGRYGGYRLAPTYRLPPLMLGDDEALAVLLGLAAGRRTGLAPAQRTAAETASAKIRRVLPPHLARRLDALLDALAFTPEPGEPGEPGAPHESGEPGGPGGSGAPDAAVLLTLADAVRHRRPVHLRYTDREQRRSERTLHPDGIVAHAGRWYVTGRDAGCGQERTFRLDRIADARALPGSFEAPPGEAADPAERLLARFAAAEYRHEVVLRVHGTPGRIRARLPASVATLEECEPEDTAPEETAPGDTAPGDGGQGKGGRWWRVRLRAQRLDWLPPVLAALDAPFVIERPDELRALVLAFADRLAARAAAAPPAPAPAPEPRDRP